MAILWQGFWDKRPDNGMVTQSTEGNLKSLLRIGTQASEGDGAERYGDEP